MLEVQDLCYLCLCFLSCLISAQTFQSVKKLSLHIMAIPGFTRKSLCNSRNAPRITLDFVSATMPQCEQTDLKELCFPHKDTSNPHITENRFPGALRQLRRLSRLNVCHNYTISYSVDTGGDQDKTKEQNSFKQLSDFLPLLTFLASRKPSTVCCG